MSDLTWWFAPHPAWEPGEDWAAEVPVVRYETDDQVVLIDPFLPPGAGFDPHGKPVRVLLAQPAHYRRHERLRRALRRLGVGAAHAVWRHRPRPATTEELPRRVEAIELHGEPQQVVFLIRDHATLVSGDVMSAGFLRR